MTPEQWRRTEELFHRARSLTGHERQTFLDNACGADASLKREVESLLAESTPGGVLDGPTLILPDMLAPPDHGEIVGRTIGGYRFDGLLGAGGMGEVYRAFDVRLGRDVAIKILPAAFTSDADRLARFEREARMLAALNHQHLCAIYGIEEVEGIRFLVLELVPGETLAELIARRGALPRAEAVAIATQIAEALETAHDRDIIHRDLKPANIKITPTGSVKVLDFGLAKTIFRTDDGGVMALEAPQSSGHGVLIGTAAYMSPEQARGLPADKRTDVWSFGCVLYEMLTGQTAFGGATISDSIAKVLEREPSWSALPPDTPEPIRRVLTRCLTKDLRQRMRDVGDARIELENPGAASAASGGRHSKAPAWRWSIVAGLSAAVTAALMLLARQTINPLDGARVSSVTDWEGAEEGAEISPDGKFIAFLSDHDGEFDLWLTQFGSGHFTNLTSDFPNLAAAGTIVRKLGFTNDGAELWFNPADRKPLLLIPFTGGTPRAFIPDGSNTPAWSNDGSRLVFFGKPPRGDDPMFIADRTGGNAHQLSLPAPTAPDDRPIEGRHSNNPVWSRDDRWIYFVSGKEPQNDINVNVWRARADGAALERLTNQHAAANYPVVLDSRTLLYVAREENGSGPWLWSLDIPTRHATRVSSGAEQYMSISASRDGKRIAATIANPTSSLWRLPLSSQVSGEADAAPVRLPVPTGRASAPRLASDTLYYLAARGTADGLWKVDRAGQSSQLWRTVEGAIAEPPAVSPDGSHLAIVIRQGGRRTLWVMSENGADRRSLAPSIDMQGAAGQSAIDWSPDGNWIIAGGSDDNGPALFKIRADGGQPRRVIDGSWVNPIWSRDGKLIIYAGRSLVGQVQLHAMTADGADVEMPPVMVRPGGYRFLPDSSGLIYLPGIHAQEFWRFDFQTGRQAPVARLENRGALRTFDISADGHSIVFDRARVNSNVILIERP